MVFRVCTNVAGRKRLNPIKCIYFWSGWRASPYVYISVWTLKARDFNLGHTQTIYSPLPTQVYNFFRYLLLFQYIDKNHLELDTPALIGRPSYSIHRWGTFLFLNTSHDSSKFKTNEIYTIWLGYLLIGLSRLEHSCVIVYVCDKTIENINIICSCSCHCCITFYRDSARDRQQLC